MIDKNLFQIVPNDVTYLTTLFTNMTLLLCYADSLVQKLCKKTYTLLLATLVLICHGLSHGPKHFSVSPGSDIISSPGVEIARDSRRHV